MVTHIGQVLELNLFFSPLLWGKLIPNLKATWLRQSKRGVNPRALHLLRCHRQCLRKSVLHSAFPSNSETRRESASGCDFVDLVVPGRPADPAELPLITRLLRPTLS
jgi:hypothetical protein